MPSSAIRGLYITGSVPVAPGDWPVLRVVSLAPLLAVAIQHLWTGQSLAELYEGPIAGAGGL